MKYLVVSDIHGSLPRLEQVLSFYDKERYDMLLILGDILNYGPRNGVPEGLNAPGIVEALNRRAEHIVAVRGNCDSEVDQMLLNFPMMSDYFILVLDGKRIIMTHGHIGNVSTMTLGYEVIFTGHTHLWQLERIKERVICNTGSITFPKDGNPPTFATIDEDGMVRIRTLDGAVAREMKL